MRRDAVRDPVTPTPVGSEDVVLLLPGMTLNATVFPDVGLPTIPVDFARLVVGPDGWSPELAERGIAYYADLLTERLSADPRWRAARRRFVIGHSFGGMLALAWLLGRANERTEPVDGLVLVSTTAGPMFRIARVRLARIGGAGLRVPSPPLMPLWHLRVVARGIAALTGPPGVGAPVDFPQRTRRSDIAVGLA